MRRPIPIVLLLTATGSCVSPARATPSRLLPLIQYYSPALHLGMSADQAHIALGGLPLDANPRVPDPVDPGIDGFSLSRLLLRRPLRDRLLQELELAHPAPTGVVEGIILSSILAEAPDSAERRISRTLGMKPTEGCGGFPGIAVDLVLSWTIGDEGGVIVTIPYYRAPGGRSIAQLVFFAGPWKPETVAYDYHPGACPPSPK